ncbi:phage portal protein [Janthinobacterium sp. GB4P2]|uniref:phage portal protein n=1 Tax=Janthinobacterium sp. GB4P2 TaxID=3424189 RepID=UPI003F220271
MSFLDFFRPAAAPEAQSRPGDLDEVSAPAAPAPTAPNVQASTGHLFAGLDDPDLLAFMRTGGETASGAYVNASKALQNMALLRCVTLISESIGMLPLNLVERGDEKKYATKHPLYRILKAKPNTWQTAYEFKSLMQLRVMMHGNAYARVIWSRGQVLRLIPMCPKRVTAELDDSWNMVYTYTRKDGGLITLPAAEVFHLRDLSEDGIVGLSRVRLAHEAIGIAQQAEKAAARLFKNGVMAGGALSAPSALSETAFGRLKDSINEKTGAENAGKWMILEEGLKAEKWANTAADAQHIENRNHQIEEIARAMGVPRPLLMMDDTSWGSGIEQLTILFIQFALQHWFTIWEQAIERTLLSDGDSESIQAKFNEKALLRGTLKDQAEFFAKALGSGGHAPWMAQNEVRELLDMPRSNDKGADELRAPANQGKTNEPAKTT